MTTYDNLNIAQTTLIFQMVGQNANSSIASGIFDLSSLAFLPNVPLIDQIEVERIFDTGEDTKFNPFVFTIANRREMFIFPKDWYTINEQTKTLTFKNLNTIPVHTDGQGGGNGLYYPYSRTYKFATGPDLDIPVVQATSTQIGTVVRNADIVYIRRKTPSINSIVTFAPGTRLTTTQLNLQFDQLKYIVQELVSRIKNEAILKYDENAIDGPFLGQGDLKMNGNSLKDLGSLSITTMGTSVNEANSNLSYSAKDFAASVDKVYEAVTSGTVYRSGLAAAVGSKAFTGDFTASGAKITNVANGSTTQDVATMGQIKDASNLTEGTLAPARLNDASIPLEKLSASRVTYTLPSDALPTILASATAYGSSTDSNTNNMVYLTTDLKGRISAIGHRSMSYNDLPTTTVTGTTYGSGKLLTLGINNKGIITSVSDTAISNANLPASGVGAGTYGSESGTAAGALPRLIINDKGIVTTAGSRAIEVNDLPTNSVTGAGTKGQATATNANNMLQITYDTAGRVTSASHRTMGTGDLPSNIPLSKLNGTNDGFTLPTSAIGDTSIVLGKINFAAGGTIPSGSLPSIDLEKINASVRGTFVLPEDAVPLVPSSNTAASTWSTYPVKDFKVDAKGRIFDVSQRAFTDGDIGAIAASKITSGIFDNDRIPEPATKPVATGSTLVVGSSSAIPIITVDSKGRINTLTSAALAIENVSGVNAAVNTLIDTRALSRGTSTTAYDAVNRLISNVATPATATDAATKGYVDTDFTKTSGLNAVIDNRLQTNSVYLSASGILNAVSKRIINVTDPVDPQDVVTKKYLTDNSIALISGNYSIGNKPIIGLTMRASADLTANDAVNFGYIQALTLYGPTTDPQTFTNAWTLAGTATGGNLPYEFPLATLAATTAEMVIVTDSQGRIYIPSIAVPTVAGRFFRLDTSVSPKKIIVYLESTTAPTGSVYIRNFGTSRSVAGNVAGATTLGLVQIPTTGGLLINSTSGDVTLNAATSSQLGGIKIGTGLSIASGTNLVSVTSVAGNAALGQVMVAAVGTSGLNLNITTGDLSLPAATTTQLGGVKVNSTTGGLLNNAGVIAVDLSDSVSSTSATTAANSKAVKAAYDKAVDVQTNLTTTNTSLSTTNSNVTTAQNTANAALPKAGGTLTGPLALATGTNIPLKFTAAAPTSPTDGSVWYESNTLRMQIASGPKTVAFTDSTLTGSAASATKWTTGMNLALGGALGGNVTFDGSTGATLTASIADNGVALGSKTTGDYVATVSAGDGITVTGTGETAAVTVTNSDRGSLQTMFKKIAGGGTEVIANSNNALLSITGSSGITVTGDNATKVINIASSLTLPNCFSTITVQGQSNVVADTSTDTLDIIAGTGMSVVTSAASDSLTFNNTGILSVAGSSNQITVANSSGAVSLTLPQSIGTSSDVQFGSAILNTVRISKVANTIDTTSGNLILAPTTAATTVTGSLGVSTTLGVTGASTLSGAVTLGSTLALSAADATITLGNSLTSISRANAVSGDYIAAGDMILRVKNAAELFLIRSDTNTTTALATDVVITQGKLNTAISGLAGTYMSVNGTRLSNNNNQILGTAGSGSFIVAQGAGSGTAKLTIANNGAATFANALTVSSGGLNIAAGGLTSVGTTSLTGAVTINNTAGTGDGLVTCAQAPTNSNHLANVAFVNQQVKTARAQHSVRWTYAGGVLTPYAGSSATVTRTAAGIYDIAFSVAMPYSQYHVCISFNYQTTPSYGNGSACPVAQYSLTTTTGLRIFTGKYGGGGGAVDFNDVSVQIFSIV